MLKRLESTQRNLLVKQMTQRNLLVKQMTQRHQQKQRTPAQRRMAACHHLLQ